MVLLSADYLKDCLPSNCHCSFICQSRV